MNMFKDLAGMIMIIITVIVVVMISYILWANYEIDRLDGEITK